MLLQKRGWKKQTILQEGLNKKADGREYIARDATRAPPKKSDPVTGSRRHVPSSWWRSQTGGCAPSSLAGAGNSLMSGVGGV